MGSHRIRNLTGVAAVIGLMALATGSFAQKKEAARTPSELLPAETVFYTRFDGSLGHEETYSKTAAYQALHESGLAEVFDHLLTELGNVDKTARIVGVVQHLRQHGGSLAVAVDAPKGKPVQIWATAVAPFAGEGVELLKDVLTDLSEGKIKVQETKVKGRQVKYVKLDNPLVELGWWEQGEDLVLAFGMNAIANSLAVADGERPNLTSHSLWEKYSHVEDDFDVTQLAWLDFKPLREKFGSIELPPVQGKEDQKRITVSQLLEILGLQNLNHAASLSGYRGDSLWSENVIDAPGERTGLLSLLDQEPFKLEDLPAMPLQNLGIMASSFNAGEAFDTVLDIVRQLAELGPPDAIGQIDMGLKNFKKELKFAPQDLLGSLGSIHCLYTDSTQSLFGLGAVGLVQVKDQAKLVDCLKKLLERIVAEVQLREPGNFQVGTSNEDDRTTFTLQFPKAPFVSPVISVGEDWMIVGLLPQAVNAQLMRMDGRLFSWSIEEDLADSLEMLPGEITSLQVVDPTNTYKVLLGLAPTFVNFAEMGLRQSGQLPQNGRLAINANEIPPAELVVQPLFPNVTVTTVEENGWHAYSRQSLPGMPLIGGSGSGVGPASAGVLVALLLPAVQQARTAARLAQSKNNLKQIVLALHNYHETYDHFPEGTIPNEAIEKPEERLSWLVSILPFVDEAWIYSQIKLKEGFEGPENQSSLELRVSAFLAPVQTNPGEGPLGKTNYVGIGGLGENGPLLPVDDPKAGFFGYNRFTRLRDITDGTSNTIAVAESTEVSPWGQGGKATVRPFTQKPYLNGPDGIGSVSGKGTQFGFADGSVRTISDSVDPKVIEAITTIAGGEVVNDF